MLQGALLLTEVMKEQEAQIDLKKNKKNWQKERDQHLHMIQQKVGWIKIVNF